MHSGISPSARRVSIPVRRITFAVAPGVFTQAARQSHPRRAPPLDDGRVLHEDGPMNPRLLLNPLIAFLLVASCRPALASVVVTIVGDEVDAQISVSAPGCPT